MMLQFDAVPCVSRYYVSCDTNNMLYMEIILSVRPDQKLPVSFTTKALCKIILPRFDLSNLWPIYKEKEARPPLMML